MMKRPHTALIVFSALMFLGSTSFADLNNVHFLAADFPAEHQLYSHDCGPGEVHPQLGAEHLCLPCYRVAFTTTQSPGWFSSPEHNDSRVILSPFPVCELQDISRIGAKRGPPVFSLS